MRVHICSIGWLVYLRLIAGELFFGGCSGCRARQKNRELGIQLFKQGNYADARKHFTRAADVTPFMAHRVIQGLKAKGVRYVVAPYEADAQLAYLMKNGLADGVITEDSDCLPFGCGTVLFKLDKDGVGLAQEIKASNLKNNTGLQFHMFTHEMVRRLVRCCSVVL